MTHFTMRSKVFLESASPKLRQKVSETVQAIEAGRLPNYKIKQIKGQDFLVATVTDKIRVFFKKIGDNVDVLDILDVSRFR